MQRLTALAAVLAVNVAFAQAAGTINLGVGTQKVVSMPGIQRVAVGDDSVLDIKTIGNNQVLLVGLSAGRTTLLIWEKSGKRLSYEVLVRSADAAVPKENDTTLALRTHEQRVVDVQRLKRVAVGDPAVADVKTLGDSQVLVTGMAPGKTSLIVWSADDSSREYVVSVSESPRAVSASDQELAVKVGASLELAVAQLARVAIGDAAIADVATSPQGLTIKGIAPGTTTMITWHADGSRRSFKVSVTR